MPKKGRTRTTVGQRLPVVTMNGDHPVLLGAQPDATVDPNAEPTPVVACRLYMNEGELSIDGRAIDSGSTNFNRPPPLGLSLMLQNASWGHEGAVKCGAVMKMARSGDVIVLDCALDLDSEYGREAARLGNAGLIARWSPEFADVESELEVTEVDAEGYPIDGILHMLSGTITGACILDDAAFTGAVIEWIDASGTVVVPKVDGRGPDQAPMPADPLANAVGPEGTTVLVQAHATVSNHLPPASHFSQPDMTELQRFVTLTAQGQVFGHLAGWGECHIGHLGTCVEPPREDDFDYFHVGQVRTREGELVATGVLTIVGGHADGALDWRSAQSHYDDPRSGLVDVRMFADEFGISFSGALRPEASELDVHRLLASGVSGDWRRIAGSLRLIGACSVNVPGFPKVRARLAADGSLLSLVAAGGRPRPAPILADVLLSRLERLEAAVFPAPTWDDLARRASAPAWDTLAARIA